MASRPHSRVWFSPHGTEWEAETYEEALEKERDSLVEQRDSLVREKQRWNHRGLHGAGRVEAHSSALAALERLWMDDRYGYPFADRDRKIVEDYIGNLEEQLEAAQEQLAAPRDVTALRVGIDWHSHDGMVTVYDRDGRYMGCMGVERFHRLLAEDAISRGSNPASEHDGVDRDGHRFYEPRWNLREIEMWLRSLGMEEATIASFPAKRYDCQGDGCGYVECVCHPAWGEEPSPASRPEVSERGNATGAPPQGQSSEVVATGTRRPRPANPRSETSDPASAPEATTSPAHAGDALRSVTLGASGAENSRPAKSTSS